MNELKIFAMNYGNMFTRFFFSARRKYRFTEVIQAVPPPHPPSNSEYKGGREGKKTMWSPQNHSKIYQGYNNYIYIN